MLHNNKFKNFNRLVEIVEKLRAPDGCPWDKEQTHETLRENLLQESYEAIDAIESNNPEELKEELGDVLLQVVLHSQIASEENKFDVDDVAQAIADKIVRRHPHVFGDINVKNTEEVLANWDKIKKLEKPERKSALSGITKSQPALMTSSQISKKAVKVGFEWPNMTSLWECLESEIVEFKEAVELNDQNKMEDEFGDILFSLVNVARWYKIEPELALSRANKKFIKRFLMMEQMAEKNLSEYSQEELEEFWKTAKEKISKEMKNV